MKLVRPRAVVKAVSKKPARVALTTAPRVARKPGAPFPIVGIGASSGGLEAFTQLLKHLPPDTGMAFVLIQHLDPTQPSFLREALAKATAMPVSEAVDRELVEPNHVYVISPRADIAIQEGRLILERRPKARRLPHLPVDSFLRSLAEERGNRAFGVVLSGNASDGTEGLRAIKAADGITFAQHPKTAKFGSMPRSAVNAGVVDYSLAIPEIGRELARLSRHPYVVTRREPTQGIDDAILSQMFFLLRNTVGVDFSEYKGATFERRVARRMALRRADNHQTYLSYLQEDPEEIRALYEDILIHVTSFFRDPEVFESLKTLVFPQILKHKAPGAPLRLWVAGCSSGEEVYSLAIALTEFLGKSPHPIQIFGSDVSDKIIDTARAGVFPDSALRNVSDARRSRFFAKIDHGYRIVKSVRDLCVFVQHDLAQDPPFSRLDLVSCRNVLIYFDQALQKRVIPTLHYALAQPGFLVLGHTENISGFDDLFSPADKANRIFGRTARPSALRFARRSEPRARGILQPNQTAAAESPRRGIDISKQLDHLLLARYAPPGVLINEGFDILKYCGQTGAYLQPAAGQPQNNLLKMVRGGLLGPIRATLDRARNEMAPARKDGVEVEAADGTQICNVVVTPFTGPPDQQDRLFVVLFEKHVAPSLAPSAGKKRKGAKESKSAQRPSASERARGRLPKLEHELLATKEYLQSLIEDHVRTTEDLGSANEELVSGNEELQSLNEELETAKEELQATNEELTTVNEELQNRNQEATQTNSDLVNLLATVDIPILILDTERRIRRFTPRARSILNVLPSDVGRPFDDIKTNIEVEGLDQRIAEVVETLVMQESDVQDREGRWYRMQIRPYKTTDNVIDGAILSLVDIDAFRLALGEADRTRREAEQANGAKDQFLAVLSHELRTPLTAILLHAQILRQADPDPAKTRRAGDAVERSARAQLQLVDDLLDVSRISSGKIHLEIKPVDLVVTVRAAIDDVSGVAARKSIEIVLEMGASTIMVAGDPVRLQQVVSNLLTNAVKFTPSKGKVTVEVDVLDGRARLVVSDTGVGIDAAFLPEVFNRFAQADSSRTRAHGGLGLGLAIVRHLLELHRGTVCAESAGIGKGSTFSLTLPIMSPSTFPPPAEGLPRLTSVGDAEEAQQCRSSDVLLHDVDILIVDDDIGAREAIAEMLRDGGARVRMAESAADAMAAMDFRVPELLLCDIAMPVEDGYSFLRRLRARGPAAGGDIPALALTALAGEGDRRRALAAGFQVHLAKPVDIDRLKKAVVDLILSMPAHADAMALGSAFAPTS